MLFITNRVLQEGITPKISNVLQVPRPVNFDLQDNQAEQSVYLCRRNGIDDYTEIGGQKFLSGGNAEFGQNSTLRLKAFD